MLQSYVPPMNKQSMKIVDELKEEVQRTGSKPTSNATHILSYRIMAMLLESIIDCNESDIDPQFLPMAEKGDQLVCSRLSQPLNMIPFIYNLTQDAKQLKVHVNFLRDEARKLVEKRLAKLKSGDFNANVSKPVLIDALINDHESKDTETSLEDIVDEVVTFLAAGWDTTTWTATVALMMLGHYPDVQEKVYQEIKATINDIETLTMAETMKLKYMECVINETMRLFPLVTIHGRRVEVDVNVNIDGRCVEIPVGSQIIIDSELLHKNPRYWSDPERFIPERFLPENSIDRDPYAFMPFSAGPRNCIGKAFGIMEDKIILAHILNSFEVSSPDPIDKIKWNTVGIARRTYEPIRFQFKLRNNGK